MARRLLLGPILILALLALLWADAVLADTVAPARAAWLALPDGRFAPGLVLLAFGCFVCGRAAIELARMYRAAGIAASRRVVVFAAMSGVIAGGLSIPTPGSGLGPANTGALLATAAAAVVVVAFLIHTRHQTVKGACGAVGAALTAFAYAGVMLGFLMALRTEFGAWAVLGVILTAKFCDIGAYFTGTLIGRHKLIPWLSPGKTWEGLIGGIVWSGLIGLGLSVLETRYEAIPGVAIGPLHGFVFGSCIGLVAQLGDLSASVLKRDAGIKDSGRILPGFGGVIDIVDSLVLVGPAAFWYLVWLRAASGS
jgi:phosphatidate cytidylyltransferase